MKNLVLFPILAVVASATTAPPDDYEPPEPFIDETDQEGLHEAVLTIFRKARGPSASAEKTEITMEGLKPLLASTVENVDGTLETVYEFKASLPPKAPMYSIMRGFEEFFGHDKTLKISPNILVFSFNRFPTSRSHKLTTHIYFPGSLDLSKILKGAAGDYRLIGAIHDVGLSPEKSDFIAETFSGVRAAAAPIATADKMLPNEHTVVTVIYERMS